MQQVPILVQQDHLQTILLFATPVVVAISTALQMWLLGVINLDAKKRLAKVAESADLATSNAESAAVKASETSERVLVLADKTHTLVNSQMGQQLMLNAITARTLANLTKESKDIASADAAEEKLRLHQKRQDIVDVEHPDV